MQNRLKYICLVILVTAVSGIALFLIGCDKSGYKKPDYFTVMFPNDGVGYTLNDDTIKKVKPDTSVEFDIILDDGYEFVNCNVGHYSDGKLKIDKVEYSVTVNFIVRLSTDIACVENGSVTVNSVDGGAAKYGQLADFCITPYKNYVVEEVYVNGEKNDFLRESNGNVIITELFDEYVSVNAVCLGKECNVAVNTAEFGIVNFFCDNEVIRYGDTVRIEAVPDNDFRVAYLMVNDLALYGEHSYEFIITDNTYLDARFVNNNSPVIIYDYNKGGISTDKFIDVYNPGDFFYLQNGVEKWEYEGYTLESWNTQVDGSGERHALGAMIAMPSDDIVMYAQYKKQTDAEYFEFSEFANHNGEIGYAISAFSDGSQSLKEVVLPDSYSGKRVFAVSDEAFRGVDTVYSIVTNTIIEKIGDYAFAEMQNLTELYLYDSLRDLSETALTDSDNLRKLHINSAGKRVYDRILETNVVDKQMYVKTSTKQKIVTLSGCSIAKGMNSEKIYENEYLKDYDIINMGVHARYGLGFLMDMVDNYLNPGDIVVLALENYEHLWFTENSNYLINSQQPGRLKHLESNYDIYEEFDLVESRYTNNILPVLPQYFSTRAQDLDSGIVFAPNPSREMMNEHGDYTYFRGNNPGTLIEYSDIIDPEMYYLDGVGIINAWAQKHIDRGVRFCFIFPPSYKYSTYDEEENVQKREQFQTALKEKLVFPVIGTLDDVVMPYWHFNDHIYHPSTYGARIYTDIFIDLLSNAVKEGVV